MRPLRNLLLGLLLFGHLSDARAQLITPVEGSGESVGAESADEQPKKRAPVLAAKWPFKFGKKLFGKEEAADPFLEGATAQRHLATQLSGRNGIAVTPPAAPQNGKLVPPASYPWPAPVDSGPQVVIPAGASSNTTWQPAPIEANAAAQLPSNVSQSPATAAVARSGTSSSSGRGFSHFAASSAKNPPPAAIPIPTPASARSAIAANPTSLNEGSMNVPAAALLPNAQADVSTVIAPPFENSSMGTRAVTPPNIVPPAARPTTLSAGPPVRPPVDQPWANQPPNANSQVLTPPSTSAPSARSTPAPAAGQFSVDQMDQDIWGPPMAKGSAPRVPNEAASPPSSQSFSAPSPPRQANRAAAAPDSVSRDEQFVPPGGQARPRTAGRQVAAHQFQPPAAPPSPPSLARPTQDPPRREPFGSGPSVALLESPVLSESSQPAANSLVHGTLDEGTRVLAIVGDQSILAGDVLGQVNEMLAPYRGQASEAELAFQREKLIQEMLPRLIERKLIFYDFLKQIPIEKLPDLEQEVFKHFNEKRLPEILEKTNLKSGAELDAKLRLLGSSLANQQRLFFEQMVSAEAVQREARRDDEVSHDEMLAYYNEHLADYSFPAKVRWERLAVDPSRYDSPEIAYNALARMGNEVIHGANFADVARRSSHGPKAAEGGQHDWTTKGSLVNKEIDRLLFMLPEGQLSKVLKSESMYQIIRVIERVDSGTKPFTALQNEIVEKMKEKRFDERVQAYVARLRDETYVWTSTGNEVTPAQFSEPATDTLTR